MEDSDKHEARLATALNIDRASKILGRDDSPSRTASRAEKFECPPARLAKTEWNGSEWVNYGLKKGTEIIPPPCI